MTTILTTRLVDALESFIRDTVQAADTSIDDPSGQYSLAAYSSGKDLKKAFDEFLIDCKTPPRSEAEPGGTELGGNAESPPHAVAGHLPILMERKK